MMRYLLPLILCVLAVGLFIFYTNPTYQASQVLAQQNASYDAALSKAAQLHAVRDQLLAKYNSFSPQDLSKLQSVLPDNVDNIRLIIDIDNIASQHGLSLSNVQLGDLSGSSAQCSGPVGSVEVGFTVTTDYNTFLAFLQDLQHSLRIIDVDSITFNASVLPGSLTAYTLQIRTYWLH
jgi:Tfp pilus assembly protein PilO